MAKSNKDRADELCDTVEKAVEPPMSKEDALEIQELVIERLEANCEALKEEMGDDAAD